MQWLIDIIKEWIEAEGYALQSWVQAQGYLTTSFVDRGVAVAYDFEQWQLTTDGNWHNLDLSAIVPAGAKAVLFRTVVKDNLVNMEFLLRSHETPSNYNVSTIYTQVANQRTSLNMIIHPDSNRIIEYKATNTTWTEIFLTVRGWWV